MPPRQAVPSLLALADRNSRQRNVAVMGWAGKGEGACSRFFQSQMGAACHYPDLTCFGADSRYGLAGGGSPLVPGGLR